MKWQTSVVIISLILNVLMFGFGIVQNTFAQTSAIVVPSLKSNQSYYLNVPIDKGITCVDLEIKLGLRRGDIESITNDSITGVTVKFKKDVTLTASQAESAAELVKGHVPTVEAK